MITVIAFVLGSIFGGVIASVVFSALYAEATEVAYRKGYLDGLRNER